MNLSDYASWWFLRRFWFFFLSFKSMQHRCIFFFFFVSIRNPNSSYTYALIEWICVKSKFRESGIWKFSLASRAFVVFFSLFLSICVTVKTNWVTKDVIEFSNYGGMSNCVHIPDSIPISWWPIRLSTANYSMKFSTVFFCSAYIDVCKQSCKRWKRKRSSLRFAYYKYLIVCCPYAVDHCG